MDERETARRVGADFCTYLTKPVKPSILYEAIIDAAGRLVPASAPRVLTSAYDTHLAENHPLRILVAEDNATNQMVARLMLSRLGYKADFVSSGLLVLEALDTFRYDVVFMDVQMPEMDGLTASQELNRRFAQGQRPRIVAMTANAMEEDRRACLDAGMDDYISKPIIPNKLVEALLRCRRLRDTEITAAKPEEITPSEIVSSEGPQQLKDSVISAEALEQLDTSIRKLRRAIDTGKYDKAVMAAREIRGVARAVGIESVSTEAWELENWDAERFAREGVVIAAHLQQRLAELKRRISQVSKSSKPSSW
jgi:CheY-like chemotaxis protein